MEPSETSLARRSAAQTPEPRQSRNPSRESAIAPRVSRLTTRRAAAWIGIVLAVFAFTAAPALDAFARGARSSGGYSRPSSGGNSRTPSFGGGSGGYRTPSTSGGDNPAPPPPRGGWVAPPPPGGPGVYETPAGFALPALPRPPPPAP